MSRLWILGLLSLLVCLPAIARDGVLEINQTCAVHTGCFDGDAPGFPVRVSDAASYRLTSALDATSGPAALEITADGAVIDMNGFSINAGDVRDYVEGGSDIGEATTLRNGFVLDASVALLSSGSRVEEVTLHTDGTGRIQVGPSGRVHRSMVVCQDGCSGTGIEAGAGSSINENTVSGYSLGIECSPDPDAVEGCQVARNLITGSFRGIDADEGGAIVHNVLRAGGGYQIEGTGLMVEGNDIGGQLFARGSQLFGNVIHGASNHAYHCYDTLYQANAFVDNNGGNDNPQMSFGNCISFQTNVCGWDEICP